ncbi:MAG: GNAT family N-acetyltransferase [Rubellimicrobium sp.]|nr:GNAT family N-acetyltransferase [Rubellimicrobium sp.]
MRPLTSSDRRGWRALWDGYLRFYRAELPKTVTDATWARLLDPASPYRAICAEDGSGIVGLCHSVIHATTWDIRPVWYLQDLFVLPAARGCGTGKSLILAAEAAARAEGCGLVYWQTQEFNGPARAIYETLATRMSVVVYEKGL